MSTQNAKQLKQANTKKQLDEGIQTFHPHIAEAKIIDTELTVEEFEKHKI